MCVLSSSISKVYRDLARHMATWWNLYHNIFFPSGLMLHFFFVTVLARDNERRAREKNRNGTRWRLVSKETDLKFEFEKLTFRALAGIVDNRRALRVKELHTKSARWWSQIKVSINIRKINLCSSDLIFLLRPDSSKYIVIKIIIVAETNIFQ